MKGHQEVAIPLDVCKAGTKEENEAQARKGEEGGGGGKVPRKLKISQNNENIL